MGMCIWRGFITNASHMLLLAFKSLSQENLLSGASSIRGSDRGSPSHWCHVAVGGKPQKDFCRLLTSGLQGVYCQRVEALESSNSKVAKRMWLPSQETLRSLHGPKTQRGSKNAKNESSFVTTSKKPAEFCCVAKSAPCDELSGVPQSRTVPSPTFILPSPPPGIGTGLGVPDINHAWQQARKYAQPWREKENNHHDLLKSCLQIPICESFAVWKFCLKMDPPPSSI